MNGNSSTTRRIGNLLYYKHGEVIFSENSAGKETYIIEGGRVETSQIVGGSTVSINVLRSGDFFGEMASITDSLRSVTATAVGNVCLTSLSMEELLQHAKTDSLFMVALLERLMNRLQDAGSELRNLVTRLHTYRMELYDDEYKGVPQETYERLHNLVGDLRRKMDQKDRQVERLEERLEQSKRLVEHHKKRFFKYQQAPWYRKWSRKQWADAKPGDSRLFTIL